MDVAEKQPYRIPYNVREGDTMLIVSVLLIAFLVVLWFVARAISGMSATRAGSSAGGDYSPVWVPTAVHNSGSDSGSGADCGGGGDGGGGGGGD